MSSAPTAKAAEKEHKDNKEDNFSLFLGSIGQKEEQATYRSEISEWMSYPNSLMELYLVQKKKLPSHPKLIYEIF